MTPLGTPEDLTNAAANAQNPSKHRESITWAGQQP